MIGAPLVDVTIAAVRVRIARTTTGFLVTRTIQDPLGDSVQIRRWRYAPHESTNAANKFLDEALAAGEAGALALRTEAERATRRALTGQHRMRPQAAALRALEADCVRTTVTYLHRGRELATHCADAQQRLALAGLPTAERDLPAWVTQILTAAERPADEHQPAATCIQRLSSVAVDPAAR